MPLTVDVEISIHALREEGDVTTLNYPKIIRKFQSTPSARRATKKARPTLTATYYFNPRPPRGGRPCCCENKQLIGDLFQSTPSARRATI